jgi:hypothetical protein
MVSQEWLTYKKVKGCSSSVWEARSVAPMFSGALSERVLTSVPVVADNIVPFGVMFLTRSEDRCSSDIGLF